MSNTADNIVFVSATFARDPRVDLNLDAVTPPANYTDPAKIAAKIQEKRDAIVAEARTLLYSGTIDTMLLTVHSPSNRETYTVRFADRKPGEPRPIVAVAVRDWLLRQGLIAMNQDEQPNTLFVGFNLSRIMGSLCIECAMPANRPLAADAADADREYAFPLHLWWYPSKWSLDIGQVAKPSSAAPTLTWGTIAALHGVPFASEPKNAGWEPGSNLDLDMVAAMEFALNFGILRSPVAATVAEVNGEE